MTTAGRAYVVRDAAAGTGAGEVTQLYAYTLKGLTSALEDACHRSSAGTPQVLLVMADGKSTVIRRFEDGHEVPLTPLRPVAPTHVRRGRHYDRCRVGLHATLASSESAINQAPSRLPQSPIGRAGAWIVVKTFPVM
jgi:hypothetical protein